MEWSEQSDKISASLLEVQRELGPVKKSAKNDFFKSKYATLNAVWEAAVPLLHERGVLVVQAPSSNGHDTLETELRHAESGQWVRGALRLNPAKDDPQGLGSAITYARRYTLCAMLGLMQEDDDGNAASRPAQKPAPAKKQATKAAPPKVDETTPILYEADNKERMAAKDMGNAEIQAVHSWYRERYLKTEKADTKAALQAVIEMLEACIEARGLEVAPF